MRAAVLEKFSGPEAAVATPQPGPYDIHPGRDGVHTGADIVRRAIQWPARQLALNAGEDGSVIVGKLLQSTDCAHGWNAQTGEYGDLYKWGVIDPAKVVRVAIEDAASVAGLLITTEAMIVPRSIKQQRNLDTGGAPV